MQERGGEERQKKIQERQVTRGVRRRGGRADKMVGAKLSNRSCKMKRDNKAQAVNLCGNELREGNSAATSHLPLVVV